MKGTRGGDPNRFLYGGCNKSSQSRLTRHPFHHKRNGNWSAMILQIYVDSDGDRYEPLGSVTLAQAAALTGLSEGEISSRIFRDGFAKGHQYYVDRGSADINCSWR